jgi:hypothetical protein
MSAAALAATLWQLPNSAQATLLAGDVAVIGWFDNGSPDSFAFVTLAPISAGENIYFTDNGWTGTQFRSGAPDDGDGNESLTKWSAVSSIPAGTIVRTTDSSASYSWTTSGAVPGGASGAFGFLSLGNPAEQIYAFQGPTALPLQNWTNQLYVLDDTGGFESATSSDTGDIPPGLSVAANTALSLPATFGPPRFIAFNTSALTNGTKLDWLVAIANSSNWTSGSTGTLPSGTISVVPEPSTWLLAMIGAVICGWRTLHWNEVCARLRARRRKTIANFIVT